MSLASFIKKQFIDILQWTEDSEGVLSWRYPMEGMEIQNGGTLVVRESQVAVFVNEGQIADVFAPGTYKLTTQTLPVLTYLKNWDKLFQSPFKSDVYFFSTRIQTGRRWGTQQPITIRDADFGMVRLRAFGLYSYRVADAKLFHKELSGTREQYTREDVEEQLRGIILATMANSIGASKVNFLDMAANQTLMASQVKGDLATALGKYGLSLDEFNVASVSLPDELQAALDKRIGMGMAGDLNKYTQYQVANAIPLAAQNEGGIAGIGAGLGAGVVFGQTMAQTMANSANASTANAQNAAANVAASTNGNANAAASNGDAPEVRLEKLKGLLDKGLISQADFDTAKGEVLKRLTG
ncbi:MAG: SPFH domain-containing protein [Burkholderiaceae bacterium]